MIYPLWYEIFLQKRKFLKIWDQNQILTVTAIRYIRRYKKVTVKDYNDTLIRLAKKYGYGGNVSRYFLPGERFRQFKLSIKYDFLNNKVAPIPRLNTLDLLLYREEVIERKNRFKKYISEKKSKNPLTGR